MTRNVLQSSLLSAGFSIIFQILCRFITFGINAFIVRNVGREVLGIMNVRLLLLESTLLFLSREAINRAALSATTQHKERCSWAQLINQMWLTVPICFVLCIPCVYIWLHLLSPVDELLRAQYNAACYAVAFSCVVEQCAEAPVFVTQVFCFVKLKIVLNTMHIVVRSIIFIWIVLGDRSAAIDAFAMAQVVSTFVILIGYYVFYHVYIAKLNAYRKKLLHTMINQQEQSSAAGDDREHSAEQPKMEQALFKNMDDFPFSKISELLPGVMENKSKFLNTELQTLTLSFIKQGVLKQILTEGEKYVMSMSPVLSFSQQATYDVVNNLGSLAARFIFRPIEENSYFYFTQTIARDVKLQLQSKEKVLQASKVLSTLTLTVTSIGMLAFTFGQSYSHTVLLIYGGADFVAGGLPENLLKWHCLAILFLAVNGITEGYMFATNTSKDIDKYNYLMAIFSVSFLVLSYVLTSFFGPVGFIFANCINMFCRICYSTRFIRQQFKPVGINPLGDMLPQKIFILTLIVVGLLCKYTEFLNLSIPVFLLLGCLGVAISLISWTFENYELVQLGLRYGRKLKSN